jgi:hypothetical protein
MAGTETERARESSFVGSGGATDSCSVVDSKSC